MSQGARVSWDISRSRRATDQKASDSDSSPAASRSAVVSRSSVTGIGYQHLLLPPHIEVTSSIARPRVCASGRRPPPAESRTFLESPPTNRDTRNPGRAHGSRTVTAAEKAQARGVSLRRIGRLFTPYRWQLAIVTAIIAASSIV